MIVERMKAKTGFGKGLITCLILFAQHIGELKNIYLIIADYEKNKRLPVDWESSLKIWATFENLLGSKIQTWAYAAIDHLQEIEIPKDINWDSVRNKTETFEKLVYKCRSFNGSLPTINDVDSIIKMLNEIAVEIDEIIGLNPDIGKWQ